MKPLNKVQKSHEFGDFAEEIAAQEYMRKGYVVLERNWRSGKTEIDIIAQKEDTVIIIEVKARNGKGEDALSAVTTDKRKRMIRAADTYLKKLPGNLNYRFDIVTCTGTSEQYTLEILEDAFVSTDVF